MNIISLDFAECSASLSGHWKRFSKYRSGKVLRKPCRCTPRDETRASFVITAAFHRNLWHSLQEREREILHRLTDIEDKWLRCNEKYKVSFVNSCTKFVKINQRIEMDVFNQVFCKIFYILCSIFQNNLSESISLKIILIFLCMSRLIVS